MASRTPSDLSDLARAVARLLEWAARKGRDPVPVEEIAAGLTEAAAPDAVRDAVTELEGCDLVTVGPEGVLWAGWRGTGPWIRRRKSPL